MNRMVDVTVTSNIETITSDQLVYVHDGLSSTYLTASVPSTQSLILTFTLNNDRRDWVNNYSIQSAGSNTAADPREWSFSGSNDGTTWVLLDYRTNEMFTARQQRRVFPLTGNRNSLKMFRLEIGRMLIRKVMNSGSSG